MPLLSPGGLPLTHKSVVGVKRRYRPPLFPASPSLGTPFLPRFTGEKGGWGDNEGRWPYPALIPHLWVTISIGEEEG